MLILKQKQRFFISFDKVHNRTNALQKYFHNRVTSLEIFASVNFRRIAFSASFLVPIVSPSDVFPSFSAQLFARQIGPDLTVRVHSMWFFTIGCKFAEFLPPLPSPPHQTFLQFRELVCSVCSYFGVGRCLHSRSEKLIAFFIRAGKMSIVKQKERNIQKKKKNPQKCHLILRS